MASSVPMRHNIGAKPLRVIAQILDYADLVLIIIGTKLSRPFGITKGEKFFQRSGRGKENAR